MQDVKSRMDLMLTPYAVLCVHKPQYRKRFNFFIFIKYLNENLCSLSNKTVNVLTSSAHALI